MSHSIISQLAEQFKQAFSAGQPFTMPLMTVHDLGVFLSLLD